MKYVFGALGGIVFTLIVVVFFMMSKSPIVTNLSSSPLPTQTAEAIVSPTLTPIASSQPSGGGAPTGIITGKLCYPSQFLPAGSIEAKSTLNATIVSVLYEGSQGGASNTYEIAVPAGTYILRYQAGELSGYHTDVCPTGLETSCAAENQRVHKEVLITANKTITGVDLCDFYYSDATDPGF